MKSSDCLFDRISHFAVGIALLFIALGFSVITMSILPVVGLFVVVPTLAVAFFFFKAPQSQECKLS